MPTTRIRRDRSNLRFGKRSRSGGCWRYPLILVFMLGVTWVVSTQYNGIVTHVKAWVDGEPTAPLSAVDLANTAQQAYWEGNLTQSIDLYAQATVLDPTNMGIQFEYVRVLIYGSYDGRGYAYRAETALEVATAMVQRDAQNPQAQAAYALALIVNDRPDEGNIAAQNAINASGGTWAEPVAYLALAQLDQGNWNPGLIKAEEAIAIDNLSVDAHRARALALAGLGEFDAAIEEYKQATQLHPRLYALYFEMAVYYTTLDNYDDAQFTLDSILAYDPRNVKAWTRKCEIYFRQRDDANAQESCEQAVALDDTFPEAFRQLGMVLYTQRNYTDAVTAFERCISLMDEQGWQMSDRMTQCYYIQGLAYFSLDNCAAAEPFFNIALFELPQMSDREKEITMQGVTLCETVIEDPNLPNPPTLTPTPSDGIY